MKSHDKRKLTSRLNALRSTGPHTPEGKSRSASNALKHGAYSQSLILPGESREDYDALLAAYLQRWQPTDLMEEYFVREMATTLWRLRRHAPAETSLIDLQLQRMDAELDSEWEALSGPALYGLASTALHDHGEGPRQLSRQETRLLLQYRQLHEELLLTRRLLPPAPPAAPTETTPSAPPPDAPPQNPATPDETKLTDAPPPLRLFAPVTRVRNPRSRLYDVLPPLSAPPPEPAETQRAA